MLFVYLLTSQWSGRSVSLINCLVAATTCKRLYAKWIRHGFGCGGCCCWLGSSRASKFPSQSIIPGSDFNARSQVGGGAGNNNIGDEEVMCCKPSVGTQFSTSDEGEDGSIGAGASAGAINRSAGASAGGGGAGGRLTS